MRSGSGERASKGDGGAGRAVRLNVSVVPRSSREEVAGFAEGTVRIRLTAPPVENRANEALVRFLAKVLGVPRSRLRIAAGGTGRRKLVDVEGISREEAFRRLGVPPPDDPPPRH